MTVKKRPSRAPQSHNAARGAKAAFLQLLRENKDITSAVEQSGIGIGALATALEKDKTFSAKYEKIINQQLEILFLEAVFKSKSPTLITFALTNRLSAKYNKSKPAPEETAVPIIFEEEKAAAHE